MLKKSTHTAEVVRIEKIPLEGSDNLSLVNVYGYTVVINTKDWDGREIAAFIPPDVIVDTTRPEFSFLYKNGKTHHRLTAKKFNKFGVVSYGMMCPVPDTFQVGDDAWDYLGLRRYEPELDNGAAKQKNSSNAEASPPAIYNEQYDLDSFNRHHHLFKDSEAIFITEKIHGENMRVTYHSGAFHVGSHYFWKKEYASPIPPPNKEELLAKGVPPDRIEEIAAKIAEKNARPQPRNHFWTTMLADENLQKLCRDNPDVVVYGERYGHVGGYPYNCVVGETKFAAFDILKDGVYLSPAERIDLFEKYGVAYPPILVNGEAYNFELVSKLSEGLTVLGGEAHIREGVVVEPVVTRHEHRFGRLKLKCINPEYLLKKHT